ncbi:IS4 family transposase, partial [Desulfobotulus mexicanus]
HLIAREKHGLMVQILGGLITYLLMAIYCREQFGEEVSIKRVREIRNTILNELFNSNSDEDNQGNKILKEPDHLMQAKT